MSDKQHWKIETDDNHYTWLALDRFDKTVNSLSSDCLTELAEHMTTIEASQTKALIITSAKQNGFISGADIDEFPTFENKAQVKSLLVSTHALFQRIEALSIPTVCLINGQCMGAGLELALCCDYRIALDDPQSRFALPEVRLGIHPGYGGIMRLIRLLGSTTGLDLILSGRSVAVHAAKKIGLVDKVVAKRLFKASAHYVIRHAVKEKKVKKIKWRDRIVSQASIRPLFYRFLKNKLSQKIKQDHYPAPYAVLDIWLKNYDDETAMLDAEVTSMSELFDSNSAKNLLAVYFIAEKLKKAADKSLFTGQRIHLIGAGIMGGDIAIWCVLHGYTVSLQDPKKEAIAATIKRAGKLIKRRIKSPFLQQQALDRLLPDPHGDGIRTADLVIEAIIEEVSIKQSLFKSIEPLLKRDAILATNTSSIALEVLASALQKPERLVGLHFFNPVAKMQLVEIVYSKYTDSETLALAASFALRLDKLPLPVKSSPGFLVNRVLMPYLLEAVMIESEGIPASVIDKAAEHFGMPMGPVELADTVGLDVCLSVASILTKAYGGSVPNRLQELVSAGHLGKKSGQGFYHYKKGKVKKSKTSYSDSTLEEVSLRLTRRLLNECVSCLGEQVVKDKASIDAGIVYGAGFAPFTGGPFHYIEEQGISNLKNELQKMTDNYGVRFTPNAHWETLGKQNNG